MIRFNLHFKGGKPDNKTTNLTADTPRSTFSSNQLSSSIGFAAAGSHQSSNHSNKTPESASVRSFPSYGDTTNFNAVSNPYFCTNINHSEPILAPYFRTTNNNNLEPKQQEKAICNIEQQSCAKFTEDEAKRLATQIEDSTTLKASLQTLSNWLKNGDCTEENSDTFFMLLNTTHKQVWKLMMEKSNEKEAVFVEKKKTLKKMSGISSTFEEIIVVLENTKVKKVWDRFSKGHRKQLSQLLKKADNLRKEIQSMEEVDEYNEPPSKKLNSDSLVEDENDTNQSERNSDIPDLNSITMPSSNDKVLLSAEQVHILTLIGVFLSVHPDGASIDTIYSYITNIYPDLINIAVLETLLRKFPKVFHEKEDGSACSFRKIWVFLGSATLSDFMFDNP